MSSTAPQVRFWSGASPVRCLSGRRLPRTGKTEQELTPAERDALEVLEHRRWNAYMRSEGYIYSGSTDKASRNDLAKAHNDLVPFSWLSEEEKRKDSAIGTK